MPVPSTSYCGASAGHGPQVPCSGTWRCPTVARTPWHQTAADRMAWSRHACQSIAVTLSPSRRVVHGMGPCLTNSATTVARVTSPAPVVLTTGQPKSTAGEKYLSPSAVRTSAPPGPFVTTTKAAGTVTREASERLGLRLGTVVGPGAGDQHASALGLGARPGDRVISLGTSAVIFSVSAQPVHDDLGIVDGVADAAGGYLPLVSTLNGALVTDAFARLLRVDMDEFARLAVACPASDVPVLAAFLAGERKPDLPEATGTLAGIRTDISREQLARAAVEGVLFGLRRGAEHLDRVGVPRTGRLVLTGGASRSIAYRQPAADAFDTCVQISPSVESVAVGAAMQAAACASGCDVSAVRDRWAPPTEPVAEPLDPTGSTAAFKRYCSTADWRGSDRATR